MAAPSSTAPLPDRAFVPAPDGEATMSAAGLRPPLFDISSIDHAAVRVDRKGLRRYNPHDGAMALLDAVVWHSDDFQRGLAVWHVRHDEFWVAGHFPRRPMLPGVLMVEAGAQLSCFLYNARLGQPSLAAFLRIEDASFRATVVPGDDFYVLCQEVKFGRRRFISDVQGLVGQRVTFEARISGMMLNDPMVA